MTAIAVILLAIAAAFTPPGRSEHAAAVDRDGDRLLVFGGFGPRGARPDSADVIWSLPLASAGAWSAARIENGPWLRDDVALHYDATRRRMLLFGGRTHDTIVDDLWSLRGNTWARLSASGPGARHLFASAYDEARGNLVLHGGHDLQRNEFKGDTWVFDSTWRRLEVSAPPPRAAAGMTWDPASRRVWLYGGTTEKDGMQRDLWSWDGVRWTLVHRDGPALYASQNMVPDPLGRGILIVASGDDFRVQTWLFDGTSWREIPGAPPTPRSSHRIAWDPARRRVLLFGGERGPSVKLSDQWQFDGNVWRAL